MADDKTRAEFEKWAFDQTELEEGCERDLETDCYIDDQMELAWSAWEAAVARLSEENARFRKALEMIPAILCDKELCGHWLPEEIREVVGAALSGSKEDGK